MLLVMVIAVLYQLQSNGVIIENLMATYLKEHADTYSPFVVSPAATGSPYNHDTTVPGAIDAYISSIPDPNISSLYTLSSWQMVRGEITWLLQH